MIFIYYTLVCILLFVLQLLYFKIADKYNIIDKPNLRSSHTNITLRGGGIIFYFGAIIYFILNNFQYPYFITGLSLIAAISFIDDIRPISSKFRLPVHFAAMVLMFNDWNLYSMPWYFTLLALIFSVGIINACNFMDGINGLTGVYSISVLITLLFVNENRFNFIDNKLIYILLIAVIVFSFFNFRKKARCFAGDVGSVSIAFIIVFLLGRLIIFSGDYRYILFLGVYGVDTVLTIIHRIKLKENIFVSHRKHAYQIMANELNFSHLGISLFYSSLQLILSFTTMYNYIIAIFLTILIGLAYILFMRKYFHLHKY